MSAFSPQHPHSPDWACSPDVGIIHSTTEWSTAAVRFSFQLCDLSFGRCYWPDVEEGAPCGESPCSSLVALCPQASFPKSELSRISVICFLFHNTTLLGGSWRIYLLCFLHFIAFGEYSSRHVSRHDIRSIP